LQGAIGATIAAAYLADGGLLWHALRAAIDSYETPPLDKLFRFVLVAIGLANAAWIVVAGRNRPQTVWAPPAYGDAPLPNYLIWGLPLVISAAPAGAVYLTSLPIFMFLGCPVLPVTGPYKAFSAMLVIATLFVAYRRLRYQNQASLALT
jgi:hypothetical protein